MALSLGQMLGLGGNPIYDAISPYKNTIANAGLGLMSGRNWTEGLQNAAAGAVHGNAADQAYQAQLREEEENAAKVNSTIEFLKQKYPDLAQAVESGYSITDAYNEAFKRERGGGDGAETFFGNIVPFEREDGSMGFGQVGNQGGFNEVQFPGGGRPAPTTRQIDIGTHIVTQDIYGNELFRTVKNNQSAAFDTATGTGLGKANAENIVAVESMASKLPGLKQVVQELGQLAETATYTQGGQLWDDIMRETGQMPSEGALARTKYMAMVDNQVLPLLRDTFGAAFTVQEGEALRATLGAPDKSPAEKKAVLEAFIEQKIRDVEAMQSRIPGGAIDLRSKYGLE